MNHDIINLRAFEGPLLGVLAKLLIHATLATLWPPLPNERLVGLGYALFWLGMV
jgi:hypothetical protein